MFQQLQIMGSPFRTRSRMLRASGRFSVPQPAQRRASRIIRFMAPPSKIRDFVVSATGKRLCLNCLVELREFGEESTADRVARIAQSEKVPPS
jgi:hypothetical protein